MDAKKTLLLNGLVTLAGLLLDIYGLCDLSLFPALLGLIIGIVDCVTFVWMREEIKQKLAQWKRNWSVARPHVIDTWLNDMEQGKPQVVATIIGRSVLNRVLRLVKELGYEVANISESESWLFKKYNVTFKRAR
jgi:hypothetical protein